MNTTLSPFERTISSILCRHDPIRICHGEILDEYDSEARAIVQRLTATDTVDSIAEKTHSVFMEWFDADTAGSPERYKSIAVDIAAAWQDHLK